MNIHPHQLRRSLRGFTMIEILVVVAIIAIIAALVTLGAGHALVNARLNRAKADLTRLEGAIDAFKLKRGGYPQDNPGNPALSPLFYELTGTIVTTDNTSTPIKYTSPVNGDTLTPAQISAIYNGTTTGFEYTSTDASQVPSFTGGTDNSYIGRIVIGGVTNTIFGPNLPAPSAITISTVEGKQITPFNYVSRTPTNNPNGYDLWVDISGGGHVYRICNWRKDPIVLQ